MKYSPKEMYNELTDKNFNFKKKYGQNFIIDENIIDNIINKSKINNDTMVLEIGPGAGSLTTKLAIYSKNVLCYEIDSSLDEILSKNLEPYDNVDIIYEDFLKADVNKVIKKYSFKNLYVISNLPYYITTPIIVKIIEDKLPVSKIVIMVQKEVGNRFKAKPGNKEYGSLSVFLNYYYEIDKLMDVSKNVFIPKPNVDSIVLELKRKENLLEVNEDIFFKLIRDSFKQKRKTLKNNLKDYDLSKISKVLNNYNLDLNIRAENISLEIFVAIANELGGSNGE